MPAGLIALALGGFGIGLTEFVIAGLLPEVAADFHVDEATAGWLISGYALAVVVGALGLTAAATRIPRKAALLGLMVLFVVGNLLSAIAPDYGVMLAGRILAALCHGAFFGIGSVVAAGLVAPEKQARAIAVMFTGLTAANVLGVPFGTLLGQAFGWRSTFWAITVIGVVAMIGVALLVPRDAADRPAAGLRGELSAFRSGQVWFSLIATVLGFGGMFGAFTYIAYTLTGVSGFPSSAVPWLLILFGLGLFAGNWVGGRLADRSIDGTLLWLLGALAVVLVGFALVAGMPVGAVIALVLMGAFGFATVPALQLRVLSYASHAPTLASGGNIAAFNLGNALGAWLGGLTIAAGLGYTSPLWVGAAMTIGALVVVAIAAAASRRRPSPAESADRANSEASLPFS
ncbi:MFS transporter [Leifsonia sp. 21MFCrub1.1]|uniref:MFS transporter n=1 Tax=Leifsonia sp. 21MFCrub1.1 TaxID=1798223 RepID=UPI000892A4B1|nr:MFS transporter [Leifsonia sp. 21MFCrub1.1]SEB13290.1 MFS transporter, DHA1 family, arabinose polymer transporter [Leifsonia sp. 21MFCrub1.1]